MTTDTSARLRPWAWVIFATAVVAAALSLCAWLTGGFRFHIIGIPVSVRGADRAAVIAVACAVVGLVLHDASRRFLWEALKEERHSSLLPLVVSFAAIGVLCAGAVFGARAVGGADSFGYVSQAELWRKGDLRLHQGFAASMPWPGAEWSFAPLGYRPADNHTLVPIYPPGLPLLMVAFSVIFGSGGMYYVSWVAGAALVLFTYILGTRLLTRLGAMVAALSVASSPIVLMMTLSVMSDVPVAALWLAALSLACCTTTLAASAGAGIVAGFAVLVRPNLAPLGLIPLAMLVSGCADEAQRARLKQAVAFTLSFVPFPLFIAWLFNNLYGSPVDSGYGQAADLFDWRHIGTNLQRYPQWLLESHGPLVFLFVAAPVIILRRHSGSKLRTALFGFVALVGISYLLYLPFEAWWYTRFLLPALPVMFILSVDSVLRAAAPFGTRAQVVAVLLFGIVTVVYGGMASSRHNIHRVGVGEQRYADVGGYIARALPNNAVVYSIQHSGSVRYYSGRLTIRYDSVDPDWLDRSIEHLRQSGYEPFFVLDEWEVREFKERFASQRYARLLAEPAPDPCSHPTVIYRAVPQEGSPMSMRVPRTFGCQ